MATRACERFFYYSSIQYNTPNSASRCLLALDILFRLLLVEQRSLGRDDLDLLTDHVAGWVRPLDRNALWDRLVADRLQEKYGQRLAAVEALQRRANEYLVGLARELGVFADVVNDGIGNVLLLRADPALFPGTDHELFIYLLQTANVGMLPGNAVGFGVRPGEAWFRITTIHDSAFGHCLPA